MNSRPLSLIVYFASGLISLFWSLSVIIDQFGFLWGVLALLLFPISISLTPLYVGFTTGHWLLAAIT